MVGPIIVGGGAAILASECLTRAFNAHERQERKLQFTAVSRGRWTPREARTEDGLVYPTCDFTDTLYAAADNGGAPSVCISQNQVPSDEFC